MYISPDPNLLSISSTDTLPKILDLLPLTLLSRFSNPRESINVDSILFAWLGVNPCLKISIFTFMSNSLYFGI